MSRSFDVVVAMDRDRGIARGGELPWHLPGDLAHFKRITSETRSPARQNAVIMGRKTWDTLPPRWAPLPGRKNVVLSRDPALLLPDGVLLAHSLSGALARLDEPDLAAGIERVFVVGGGEIYAAALAMPACDRLYLTVIDNRFGCDTFFPEYAAGYVFESLMAEATEGGVHYRIEVWQNRARTS